MFCIYTILVLSMNLTVGMAKILSLCHAAFYGIGAYLGTFILMHLNVPFLAIAVVVMSVTGATSYIISYASNKLRESYFILASLGFQIIVYTVLYNWTSFTKGPYGIAGIPPIRLGGLLSVSNIYGCMAFFLVVTALTILVFSRLKKGPFGRILKAIRTDDLSMQTLGRNTAKIKNSAFFFSSAFAGLAGLLYASYFSYIDPTSFTLDVSIFIITALFIGGTGTIGGSIVGALFIVLLPELLRFIGIADSTAANLRQIIYGLTLIVVIFISPNGLLGEKEESC